MTDLFDVSHAIGERIASAAGWLVDRLPAVSITERQADLVTILAIAVMFPLIGAMKLFFARVMVRNTHTRTPIGSWLVRMFTAIGVTFIFVGLAYGLSVVVWFDWWQLTVWQKWPLRITAVLFGLVSLISTAMLTRHLLPLLKEAEAQS